MVKSGRLLVHYQADIAAEWTTPTRDKPLTAYIGCSIMPGDHENQGKKVITIDLIR